MLSFSRSHRFSLDDKDSPLLDDPMPQLAWSDERATEGSSLAYAAAWADTDAYYDSPLVGFGEEAALRKAGGGGGKNSGGTTSPGGTGGTTGSGGTGSPSSTTPPMAGSSFTPIKVMWDP